MRHLPLPGERSFNAHFQYSPLFSAVFGVSESRASWFDLPTIFHCRGGSRLGVEVSGRVSPPLKQRHLQEHLLFSVPLISIFRDTPVGVLQQKIHLLLLILLISLLSLNFGLSTLLNQLPLTFLQIPKFSWHLSSVPASPPVLFVLVDVCVFCCNVSTIILRLWGQGGNKCTCFQYHHPHDTEVLECGRYRRGGAEETAGSLQGLA